MPTIKKILKNSSLKGVANAYEVITTKAKDFDEAMPVVEVRVGRLGVKDLLLGATSS